MIYDSNDEGTFSYFFSFTFCLNMQAHSLALIKPISLYRICYEKPVTLLGICLVIWCITMIIVLIYLKSFYSIFGENTLFDVYMY